MGTTNVQVVDKDPNQVRLARAVGIPAEVGDILEVVARGCCGSPFGTAHLHNDIAHEFGVTTTLLEALLKMTGYRRAMFLDERPQLKSPYLVASARRVGFLLARSMANPVCQLLGVPAPRIWSPSRGVVAYK